MGSNNLWLYPRVIRTMAAELFNDLRSYNNREIYGRFFVQRISKEYELASVLRQLDDSKSPKNVLVVGDRGVGKSCFLEWFLNYSELYEELAATSSFLDLRDIPGDEKGCPQRQLVLGHLARDMAAYARQYLNDPCMEVQDGAIGVDELVENLRILKLKFAERQSDSPVAMKLFIDDIDYVDVNCLGDLVNVIRPLLLLSNLRIILACRPPAYNALVGHSDVGLGTFLGRESYHLRLDPLETRDVVQARLHVICSEETQHLKKVYDTHSTFLRLLGTLHTALTDIVTKPDLPTDLMTIRYPFSPTQYNAIQQLSNGNITYMLAMASAYLEYLALRHEQGVKDDLDYHTSIADLFDHFSQDQIWERVRIRNLHRRKSYAGYTKDALDRKHVPPEKRGNSLFVALLQSLLDYQYIDSTTVGALTEFGFTVREIQEGVAELLEMEMLQEKMIIDRRPLAYGDPRFGDPLIKHTGISSRGRYYLMNIIPLPGYIKKYGSSGHNERGADRRTRECMKDQLLSFTVSIILLRESKGIEGHDVKVNKEAFHRTFDAASLPVRAMLSSTDFKTPIPYSSDRGEAYLRELGIIETDKLSKQSDYLIYFERVLEVCRVRQIPWHIIAPYSECLPILEDFIDSNVRTPKYEV